MTERNRQKLETGWPTLLSQHSAGRPWARHVAIATTRPQAGLVERGTNGIRSRPAHASWNLTPIIHPTQPAKFPPNLDTASSWQQIQSRQYAPL